MEKLLDKEAQINGQTNFSRLLIDQKFINGCAVVALDIYSFIKDNQKVTLQSLMIHFHCRAVDLWKVITAFKRSDQIFSRCPKALKVHLSLLESEVMMRWAWVADSPLLAFLVKELQSVRQESENQIEKNVQEVEGEDDFEEFDEYASHGLAESIELVSGNGGQVIPPKHLQSITARDQMLITGRDLTPLTEHTKPISEESHEVLRVFFKRLLQLVGERVYLLCRKLKVEYSFMETVWSLVKQTICEESILLVHNHSDHIVVCSIFAVFKLTKQNRTFHEILHE